MVGGVEVYKVETEFLWGLVVRHIPELKKDIERIIVEYEARCKNRKKKPKAAFSAMISGFLKESQDM